jgi:hypothetical protein
MPSLVRTLNRPCIVENVIDPASRRRTFHAAIHPALWAKLIILPAAILVAMTLHPILIVDEFGDYDVVDVRR